ncbi:hypothetical protein MAPG_00778 [Magnaporthiopsis poae ATCC 64411]|uniref:Secreted protein n=1 Tax=Magnaporthiopsis poae (strain ATCC 64411 / 73-15) TaxID=644358 RepID=A0A0C4DLX8_MAGP6|nr:hypothetical protein MAPG_00778 [Magnaporthiopsis poae ATCC 64411]
MRARFNIAAMISLFWLPYSHCRLSNRFQRLGHPAAGTCLMKALRNRERDHWMPAGISETYAPSGPFRFFLYFTNYFAPSFFRVDPLGVSDHTKLSVTLFSTDDGAS